MFSKTLIPIDLNNDEKSVELIKKASKLRNIKKIILLHVLEKIPEQITSDFSEATENSDIFDAEQELKLILSRANIPNKLTKIVVIEGNSCEQIIDASNKYKVDLILLCSHRTGLEKYILGSTATKVVKLAKCSVLVERENN